MFEEKGIKRYQQGAATQARSSQGARRRSEPIIQQNSTIESRQSRMSPGQVALARLYGEVMVLDVSEGRNLYKMHLTTIVVVDGDNRTRNIAYCLSERQDTDTFVWIFQYVARVINRQPAVTKLGAVFSDRDHAIAAAIKKVWPNVFHGICLWHLHENLAKNLSSLLTSSLQLFMHDFWETYRMGSPETFEVAWEQLLSRWPSAVQYLQYYIYPDREKWAWAWVGSRFTVGLRTTGRVECEHKNYNLLGLGSHSTLNEVFDTLCRQAERQKDNDVEKKLQVFLPPLS